MKEKIDRLAMELFEYETPTILLSEEELQINVVAGSSYSGSFIIKNSKDTPIKGILYSTNNWLELDRKYFNEAENIVNYNIRVEKNEPGEVLSGLVSIVSDCGEHQVLFNINVEAPYSTTSMGKIKDLFQFANLAKADWNEALKLFQSEEFQHVFLYYDNQYSLLYQNLLKSKSGSQAMEEFLIEVHKKLRINISADKLTFNYQAGEESFQDKLILSKDNWGYSELRISTDAPFISLEHAMVLSDDFVGNTYPLAFVIDPANISHGIHSGRIFIKTVHQTLTIEITYSRKKQDMFSDDNRRKIKEYQQKIVQNYLGFRMNHMTLHQYVTETGALLDNLKEFSFDQQDNYRLLHTHLYMISGNESQAKQILGECSNKLDSWKETDVVTYCGYLYIQALLIKDDDIIKQAYETIHEYYQGQYYDWKLLWFLLYIDKKYDSNLAFKLVDMKKQFEEGCHSPILYYEAASIYNQDPALLHELGEFELQVLHWGLKYNFLTTDTAIQFTYLAGKCKTFHKLVYNCLALIYDQFLLKETLAAICSLLIKGNQRNNKYFKWFNLGVEEQLRITELYEYYMYSINEEEDITLPQSLLLYFIYNSNLNDRKRAFLYAYIIKKKDENPTTYRTYVRHIEQFGMKQIAEHNINANLSILYDDILIPDIITPEIGKDLAFILFKHEIYCKNPNIKGVLVVHKELSKGIYTPMVNGTAQVDIFTENAQIFLVDIYDNFYISTVDYTLNKLIRGENYAKTCFRLDANQPMLILNLAEKVLNYQKYDEKSMDLRKSTLQLSELREEYYNNNILSLIHYYYDNYEGDLLDSYLSLIDLHMLNRTERNKIIEMFIVRDLYDKTKAALKEFGFEGLSLTRLIKICSRMLQMIDSDEKKSRTIVNLCFYIFKAGKYNEDILEYLVKYFSGTTEDMLMLWRSSEAFEMETKDLEERLLEQMLFTETYLADSSSLFLEYYKNCGNHKIIKAFLNYNAYKYLVKDRVIQSELFPIMRREVALQESDIWMLALLKEYANHDKLTDSDINFIDFNIHKFINKGIILPFFQEFRGKLTLPPKINDNYFVEYKTNPAHKIRIHYQMGDQNLPDDFLIEEMKNEFMGIFVKCFTVFYLENIHFYITEEDEEGQVIIIESYNIQLDHEIQLEEDTKYNHINYILSAMEMQDETTIMDSIENYVKTNYILSKTFHPLL